MAYQNYCQCSRLYLLVFSCGYSTTQETQHELDTFPRHARCKNMPFCASQISIFNPSDHTDTALTRCYESLQWPDCTLSPLEVLTTNVSLKNRQVTQSIATQMSSQPELLFLNRRSCPTRTLLSNVKY